MTEYKKGDKIRILDAENIVYCEASNGDIFTVGKISAPRTLYLTESMGSEGARTILESEFSYIEKVEESPSIEEPKFGDPVWVEGKKKYFLGIGEKVGLAYHCDFPVGNMVDATIDASSIEDCSFNAPRPTIEITIDGEPAKVSDELIDKIYEEINK